MRVPWNTLDRVAEILQVSRQAVRKFIVAGDLDAYEVAAGGGAHQWVVSDREVDRLALLRLRRLQRRSPRKLRVPAAFKQRPLPLEVDPVPAIRAVPAPLGRFRMAKARLSSTATKVVDRQPTRALSLRKKRGVA